jgi:undecaprenyl-diphosphatase
MDSALVQAGYGLAQAQAWFGALDATVAQVGIVVLPIVAIVIWCVPGASLGARRRAILAGCLAAVVAAALGLVLEHLLARPRPFVALGIAPLFPHAADSSFPSDHTIVGVAFAGALALRVPRVGMWLVLWALLVGVARVVAAVHYPSDILGSAILALVLDGLALSAIVPLLQLVPRPLRQRLVLGP